MSDLQKDTRRGVALVAVLWLVAAMSLIAVGIVQSVRIEIRTAGMEREQATYGALSDAAILLAIQSLQAPQYGAPKPLQTIAAVFEERTFAVSIAALNGLVDINMAPQALLADLYVYAGGLPTEQAQALATATVAYRQTLSRVGSRRLFAASEDLLQVPEFKYDLYAKIKGLITADLQGGSGRVNPLAAPVGVLQVLGAGVVRDASSFKPEFVESGISRSFDIRTTVALPDGATLTTVWVVFLGQDPISRLPWRLLSKRRTVSAPSQPQI